VQEEEDGVNQEKWQRAAALFGARWIFSFFSVQLICHRECPDMAEVPPEAAPTLHRLPGVATVFVCPVSVAIFFLG
jgi:hypothetical protein